MHVCSSRGSRGRGSRGRPTRSVGHAEGRAMMDAALMRTMGPMHIARQAGRNNCLADRCWEVDRVCVIRVFWAALVYECVLS